MISKIYSQRSNIVIITLTLLVLLLAGCESPSQINPVPTATNAPAELTMPGVVLYYPFSSNAKDMSGNQNDGQVNGAVLTADRFGHPDSAYYFDGVDDYIAFDPTGLPLGDSPRTISAWIQVESYPPELWAGLGSRPSVVAWGSQDWDQLSDMQLVDGKLQFHTYSVKNLSGTISMELGKWTHIAVVYSDGEVTLYVNGIAEKVEASHINTSVGTGKIGTWPDPPQETTSGWKNAGYFHGSIDDVSVYNQALTAEQIKALYTENGWSK